VVGGVAALSFVLSERRWRGRNIQRAPFLRYGGDGPSIGRLLPTSQGIRSERPPIPQRLDASSPRLALISKGERRANRFSKNTAGRHAIAQHGLGGRTHAVGIPLPSLTVDAGGRQAQGDESFRAPGFSRQPFLQTRQPLPLQNTHSRHPPRKVLYGKYEGRTNAQRPLEEALDKCAASLSFAKLSFSPPPILPLMEHRRGVTPNPRDTPGPVRSPTADAAAHAADLHGEVCRAHNRPREIKGIVLARAV